MTLSKLCTLASGVLLATSLSFNAHAKETYKIAWTIYAGTMPLGYAQDHQILKKWGDKFGFNLEAVQLNDYIEAQTQFTAGSFAGSVAITLDALTIPAGFGVDTTVLAPLSTSMGSDGIVLRGKGKTVADLKGKSINLVELSGSHYMLARALDTVGLSERDVKIINTSDSDIGSIFFDSSAEAVATWKPQLSEILTQFPDSTLVFDSSDIAGEIVDQLIVHTALLKKEPNLGKAIIGAWYETIAMLEPSHPKHNEIMAYMSNALNTDQANLKSQLSTIDFFNPQTAQTYIKSSNFKQSLTDISTFAFAHGLLGDNVPDAGYIGMEAGDGTLIGNSNNIKLRFSDTWISPWADKFNTPALVKE